MKKISFDYNDVYKIACKWLRISCFSLTLFLISFIIFIIFPSDYSLGLFIFLGVISILHFNLKFYWKTKFYLFKYFLDKKYYKEI